MPEPELFADISIILEYVQTYTEEHVVTNNVLSDFNGNITVTEFCSTKSDHRINNRLRLFEFIFREISNHVDSTESEENKIEPLCEEILNYEYLNDNTPLELDESLKHDLESLRDKLREDGVNLFLTEMEIMDGYTDNKREELSRKVIDERKRIKRNNKTAETYINSHVEDPIQAQNLVKSGYWNRTSGEGFVLIKHSCAANKKSDTIKDIIDNRIGSRPDIYSPVIIAEEYDLDQ